MTTSVLAAAPVQSSVLPLTDWVLEGCLPGQTALSRTPMKAFPFSIGRDPSNDLPLASKNVSKRHASILHTPSAVILQDLGSTNGTFVNGHRISAPTPVGLNDLIQFADVELRLIRDVQACPEFTCVEQKLEQRWLISRLDEVLNQGRLRIVFQPIIAGIDRQLFGYEALVRTDVQGLESPPQLFSAAAQLGQEERLSQLCRTEAVRVIEEAGVGGALFLNTDPNETLGEELIQSVASLRESARSRDIVLEIHEEAVPEIRRFRDFAKALRDLEIKLAFDDFGAGQSRLLELAQVCPDFLKFDRSLVKDLGTAEAVHEELVRTLHNSAVSLGITTLAEGLETPESIQACESMGFTLFQGYAFGRPQPISAFDPSLGGQ